VFSTKNYKLEEKSAGKFVVINQRYHWYWKTPKLSPIIDFKMALPNLQGPRAAGTERRASRRYPVNADVEFRLISDSEIGAYQRACLVNLSTNDLMLECDGELAQGQEVELMIQWPARRGKGAEIVLHAIGHTVRVDGSCTAVRIARSDFRYSTPK
jgi:hypothetical protein